MGDRFYMQQLEATGQTVGIEKFDRKRKLKGKMTKQELVTAIGDYKDISPLLLADLERILSRQRQDEPFPAISMPSGRTKKPYIEQCNLLYQEVTSFTKLTVAALKGIIEKHL